MAGTALFNRLSRFFLVVLVFVVAPAGLLAGCGSDRNAGTPEAVNPATGEPSELAQAGTTETAMGRVVGVVRLGEGVELPRYSLAALGRVEGRPPLPDICTPASEGERQPMRVSQDGGIEGLLLTAVSTEGANNAAFRAAMGEREPQTHEVIIEDCRLTPNLLAVVRGDSVRIRNRTRFPFLPAYSAVGVMEGLAFNQERTYVAETLRANSIQCGFAVPCGRSEVIVLHHDVAVVSGEGGRFELEVPAGIGLRLHAWHPLFGAHEASVEVTVEAGGQQTVELIVARPAPPAASSGMQPVPAAPNMDSSGVPRDENLTPRLH